LGRGYGSSSTFCKLNVNNDNKPGEYKVAIRIKGAKRNIPEAEYFAAVEGITDPYGEPFQLIYLDWNKRYRVQSGRAKTKGFQDTMIVITQTALRIEYHDGGNVQWQRHKLTKQIYGILAKTDYNMKVLASMHYDNMWTIRDPKIRAEVAQMAKELDARLATQMLQHVDDLGNPKLGDNGKPIVESRLAYEKRRRASLTKQLVGADELPATLPIALPPKPEDVAGEIALDHLNDRLTKNLTQTEIGNRQPEIQDLVQTYSEDELKFMNISSLRKMAKDKFGIENAFSKGDDKISKKDLIAQVLSIQEQNLLELAESQTELTEEEVVNA